MRGERLSHHISGISPLNEALDGTPVKRPRAAAKTTLKPDLDESRVCRGCGYRTQDRRDFEIHLIAEIRELRGQLGDLRRSDGRRLVAECGTPAGYRRHRKIGEPGCESCREASRRANAERRARRLAADPAQRERHRERDRERYRRRVDDPKERERLRASQREYQREWKRRRYAEDPTYRERERKYRRDWNARKKAEQDVPAAAA